MSGSFMPGHYEVLTAMMEVRALSALSSPVVARLPRGVRVRVEAVEGERGMVTDPMYGWVSFRDAGGSSQLGSVSRSVEVKKTPSLAELARILQKGLDIRDRSYRFSRYKACFIGREAVTWMVTHGYAKDRKHAVDLFNRLHRLGVVAHVVDDHAFKDAYLFYRFHDEKIPQAKRGGRRRGAHERTIRKLYRKLEALTTSKNRAVREEKYTEAGVCKVQMEKVRAKIAAKVQEFCISQEELSNILKSPPGNTMSMSSAGSGSAGTSSMKQVLAEGFSPTQFFNISSPVESKVPAQAQEAQPRLRGLQGGGAVFAAPMIADAKGGQESAAAMGVTAGAAEAKAPQFTAPAAAPAAARAGSARGDVSGVDNGTRVRVWMRGSASTDAAEQAPWLGTAVKRKGDTEWYVLFDNGNCELVDLNKDRFEIVPDSKDKASKEARRQHKESIASLASSLNAFSIEERGLMNRKNSASGGGMWAKSRSNRSFGSLLLNSGEGGLGLSAEAADVFGAGLLDPPQASPGGVADGAMAVDSKEAIDPTNLFLKREFSGPRSSEPGLLDRGSGEFNFPNALAPEPSGSGQIDNVAGAATGETLPASSNSLLTQQLDRLAALQSIDVRRDAERGSS